jgi:hypothetical protein
MWRISTLLWPVVEWWERRAERRRFRYCVELKRRIADPDAVRSVTLVARLRSLAAMFLVLFVSRH